MPRPPDDAQPSSSAGTCATKEDADLMRDPAPIVDSDDGGAPAEPGAFIWERDIDGDTPTSAPGSLQPSSGPDPDDPASHATAQAEIEEEALTARAAEAAAKLHEYQLWFPFIEEERPTADGCVSFMLPPGALLSGLEAIALSSASGKATQVRITLTPGRARLTLEHGGKFTETDVPLAEFANLPRNGLSLSTRYSTLRRLMDIGAQSGSGSVQDERSATFTLKSGAPEALRCDMTYRYGGTTIALEAELTAASPPLPSLEDRALYRPGTARALARALRHTSVFPKQTYYGPIVVTDRRASGFSRDAVVEYSHNDIADIDLLVDVADVGDLASLLGRSKLGLRIVQLENHTAFSDGIIRYRLPRPTDRQPQYSGMKEEALSGAVVALNPKELQSYVRFLDAGMAVRGMPTTVRLVVEDDGDRRRLVFTVQRAAGGGWYRAAVVESALDVGEHGRLPMQLLLRMTKSAEFETMELRLTQRTGALIQRGDGSVLTCMFPFHEAPEDEL